MTETDSHFWDSLSSDEGNFTKIALQSLENRTWAKSLLRETKDGGGLSRTNKSRLFEIRFAHALDIAGIRPNYEVTGEGASKLDFGFSSNNQAWKVELMRLEETDAARGATKESTDENGNILSERILSLDASNKNQSVEGETLKAIQRICQKCERAGRPHKFPIPDNAFHVLLVDIRLFSIGMADVHDFVHIGLGGQFVDVHHRVYWNGRLISGVFDPNTSLKGAAEIRKRVHFLGFVNERDKYHDGGFGEATQFIANTKLFTDAEEIRAAMETWPLQPTSLINNK